MKVKTEILWSLAMLVALIILTFLIPESDYEVQVEENEYWCDSVSDGYWHSSQETYVRRCGE